MDMQINIENRKGEFFVLLEEEYGYKHWFWFPKMEPNELEAWWKKLETVEPYFMSPEPLPGDVVFAEDMDCWFDLQKKGNNYEAHTHCDDDSWIKKPNDDYIYHKGYEGER